MDEENSLTKFNLENSEKKIEAASADMGASAVGETTLDTGRSNAAVAGRAIDRVSIGPYVLVRKLGEGGMGQVWLAEQTAPVKRQVALKLIKGGLYDNAVIQRFESERQSLAVMNHPSIAKIFDAGSTADGQPYFVMEYVDGLPITSYCDRKKMKVRERLELFIKVCEGVQHAHQKAIIHRDLKPSNVLVSEVDGKPVPRIIDFGIAKAVSLQSSAEQTMFTQMGALMGTPGFISPEQADPSVQDVDTRTDVYSLGVILYVLLTGTTPFDLDQWKKKPFDQVLRQLREEDPASPSTKLSGEKDTATDSAASRDADAKQLVSLLRGDLDWITLKALEKDRARRYESCSALMDDTRRYLENRPVLATPPSLRYRAGKFVRRNRTSVIAASAVVLMLFALAVSIALQAVRISKERDRANREAESAKEVSEFLVKLFEVSDPGQNRGETVTARELVDKAARDIERRLSAQPLVRARLELTLGKVYEGLGLYDQALSLAQGSLDVRRKLLPITDATVAESLGSVGSIQYDRGEYDPAVALLSSAAEVQEKAFGPENSAVTGTLGTLARVYQAQGRFSEAEATSLRALRISEKALGPNHPNQAEILHTLARLYYSQDEYGRAEPLLLRAVVIQEKALGPDHPELAASLNDLAWLYKEQGKYAQAEPLFLRAVAIREKALGPDHPELAASLNDLAWFYKEQGKYTQAEPLFLRAVAIEEKAVGPNHPWVATCLNALAQLYNEQGKYAQAEPLFLRAVTIDEKALGPSSPDLANDLATLASLYRDQGKYAQAEPLVLRVITIREKALGPNSPNLATGLSNLAQLYSDQGKYTQAEPLYLRAVAINEKTSGNESLRTATALVLLAELYQRENKPDQAGPVLEQALHIYDKTVQPQPSDRFSRAKALALAGRTSEARVQARELLAQGYRRRDLLRLCERLGIEKGS